MPFLEIATRLRSQLNSIGETTLGLDEFLDLWKSSEGAIGNAEGFILRQHADVRGIENGQEPLH